MATRNRLSMAGAGGSALLDSLDAFKRKHVSQNKEIIHRNSELMKVNADLNKRVRELQTELLSLKSENLRLAAQNTDLLHGRDTLLREHETIGNTMQAQAVRKALELIVQQAQQAQTLLNESQKQQELKTSRFQPSRSGSATPTGPIPDPTPLSAPPESLLTNRILLSTEPDLSFIAEQSVELEERPTTPLDDPDEQPSPVSPIPSSPPTPVPEEDSARARVQARRRSSALPLPQLALLDSEPSTFTMRQRRTVEADSQDDSTTNSQRERLKNTVDAVEPSLGSSTSKKSIPGREPVQPRQEKSKVPEAQEPTSRPSRADKEKSKAQTEEVSISTRTNASTEPARNTKFRPQRVEKEDKERTARRRKKEDLPPPEPIRERSTTPASEPEQEEEVESQPRSRSRSRPQRKANVEPTHDSQYTQESQEEREVLAEQTNKLGVEGLDGVKKVARRKVADLGMVEEEKGQENDTGRRARKSVNYALPNLRDKMRQPEGYVPTIKKPAARLSHSIANEATERVERRRSATPVAE